MIDTMFSTNAQWFKTYKDLFQNYMFKYIYCFVKLYYFECLKKITFLRDWSRKLTQLTAQRFCDIFIYNTM